MAAKSGDTLAKVGRRYGLTPGDLARINRFSYNTELHDGQKVVVYAPIGEPPRDVAQGMTGAARRDRGVGGVARGGVVPGKATAEHATAPKAAPAKSGKAVALRAPTPAALESKGKDEGKAKSAARPTAPPPFEPRAKEDGKKDRERQHESGKVARPEGKAGTGKSVTKKK